LRVQPAIASFTSVVRVAPGVFAPGHLGGLTQVIPFELVDAVLASTGRVQARVRMLPSRVGVYLLLAMGLFAEGSVLAAWGSLVAGLKGLPGLVVATPTETALRGVRRRVGVAPLKALFEVLAGPLAQPGTPGVSYRGWRTVAFDGCSSLTAPDSAGHRGWLRKTTGSPGPAGYPSVRLMALVETGTRGILGAVFGSTAIGERAYARRLCHLLGPGMLLLADQGFDGEDMLAALAGTRAQVLLRWQTGRRACQMVCVWSCS
jgi:hypothetical protein